MVLAFLLGTVVGACLVASSVVRTLSVDQGSVGIIVVSNLFNGVFYWISVNYVVRSDMPAYVGTVLGGLIACLLLSRYKCLFSSKKAKL